MSKDLKRIFDEPKTISILQELEIVLLFFHGSRASGKERADSDYDFAVLLNDHKSWSFMDKVERLDKCAQYLADKLEVDRDQVDIQDLETMPILMAFNIAGDGELVWEGESNLGLYFRRQAYSRYQDFEWTERFFHQALRKNLLGEKNVG